MAALTISNICFASNATFSAVTFGAAAVAGVVIKDTADASRWKNGVANSTDVLAGKDGLGILIHDVDAADHDGIIVTAGTLYINATGMVEGDSFVLGTVAAGDFTDDADIATSTWFKTHLGTVGNTTATGWEEFTLNLKYTGHQIP